MRPCIKLAVSSKPSAEHALPAEFLDQVSAFETLRAYGGRLFRLDDHLSRLTESCASMGRSLPEPRQAVADWISDAFALFGVSDATLRISAHWGRQGGQALILFVRPFSSHPDDWYENGVELSTANGLRWTLRAQDPQVKASQYVSGVLACLDKGSERAHELVFLSEGGVVAEGTVSNLFCVKSKSLLTPSVASGILKGVTRSIVLDLARKRRIPVRETSLTRHEFYTADEVFMTNTSSEVLPVTRFDGRVIGAGKPGALTKRLAEDFKRLR